jgi:hypothetical protein
MKHKVPGLHQATQPAELPDGIYLVAVRRAQYHWDRKKPFYAIQFVVLEPTQFADSSISGRLYCTQKALWKLSWFLRDFGYDSDLLEKDELDENALRKLQGVIQISHTVRNGTFLLNLDGFAPAERWPNFSDSRTSRKLAS